MQIKSLSTDHPVRRLVWDWVGAGRFRIVRYNLGGGDELEWHLLQGYSMTIAFWRRPSLCWRGVCGYDLGKPGQFNHQLQCAANPWVAFDWMAEMAAHYLRNNSVPYTGRDGLPRAKIIDELDVTDTLYRYLAGKPLRGDVNSPLVASEGAYRTE